MRHRMRPGGSGGAPGGQLSEGDLARAWDGGRCVHAKPEIHMDGRRAELSCPDCGRSLAFLLKFGRPMTFEVSTSAGQPALGRAATSTAAGFLRERATRITAPEGWADPESGSADLNRAMLSKLMEALAGPPDPNGPNGVPPPTDFEAAWSGFGCEHDLTVCESYSNRITLRCHNCGACIIFALYGNGRFHAASSVVDYGMHTAAEVAEYVRKCTPTLSLPGMMADKMSDDPERDASGVAALVGVLERHGLLRRAEAGRSANLSMLVDKVSAMRIPRATFEARAEAAEVAVRATCAHITDDGRRIPPRQKIEELRLAWPCRFEGVGIDVEYYHPAGYGGFCPKCFFTPDGGEEDYWRRGCCECGYAGYLLDI